MKIAKLTYEKIKKILSKLPKLDYENLISIEIDDYEKKFYLRLEFIKLQQDEKPSEDKEWKKPKLRKLEKEKVL